MLERITRIVLLGVLGIWCLGVPMACRPADSSRASAEKSASTTDPKVESAALDVGKQKYIWDIEHTAFELEKKFGAAFIAALRRDDPAGLHDFCLPGFSAVVLDPSKRHPLDQGPIRQISTDGKTGAEMKADIEQWGMHLHAYFEGFQKIGGVKCRVLDLDADGHRPETGNWNATLYLSAVGVDQQGAPIEFVTQHRVRCRFRNDAEIVEGKILSEWRVLSEKFRQSHQEALFEEVTAAVGLDQVDIRDNWEGAPEESRQYFSQMAVEDFNRDGCLDLAVASADGRWRLLKSVAGTKFQDLSGQLGVPRSAAEDPRSRAVMEQAFLASWIDFDNDGFPDLLIGDRLFHNVKGLRFEDVTDASGLVFKYNPKGCAVADYDGDGLTDLYVLYQHARQRESGKSPVGWVGDDQTGVENHLWRNVGNGRFVNATESARAGGGPRQSFAAAWLHANDDAYPDLYIANDFGTNAFLLNQGDGTFRDVAEAAGVADYATSMGVVAGDTTGDGNPEIYVANMFSKMGRRIIAHVDPSDYPPGVFEQIQGSCAGNRLYTPVVETGKKELKYREVSEDIGVNQVGWAYAPALADFDSDGFLDIYATAGFLSFQRDKPDG